MRHPVSGAPLRGLLRSWELKLLSLVIAFTLWLFVVDRGSPGRAPAHGVAGARIPGGPRVGRAPDGGGARAPLGSGESAARPDVADRHLGRARADHTPGRAHPGARRGAPDDAP